MTRPYKAEIKDARGIVIGDGNQVYQNFLVERNMPWVPRLITFATYIEEKTRSFIGRQFVFDALDNFVQRAPSGYFVIQGEPGIGKTAIIAQLVKTRKYVHHFFIGLQGVNRAGQFLENICVQLIVNFDLDIHQLPPDASQDGRFLNELLEKISSKLEAAEHVIILIDALDEVDWQKGTKENFLYLPPVLPRGVYIILTGRPVEGITLRVDERKDLYLHADSDNNIEDIKSYLDQAFKNEAITSHFAKDEVKRDEIIETLIDKSEGNFMYLRYVLPEILQGRYTNLILDKLPQGLLGYYEHHWQQMKGKDIEKWVTYRQPVICVLATVREPVSAKRVASITNLNVSEVRWVIDEWREFLDEEKVDSETRWRVYHMSFQDFLQAKDDVGEIKFSQIHSDIADDLLRRLQEHYRGGNG